MSRQNLAYFIIRYKTTGLMSAPRKQWRLTKLTKDILHFIDRCMEQNDETTSRDLPKSIFENFQLKISETTVKRARRKLGWLSTGTKYCQLVREVNRAKRLIYCQNCNSIKENFNDVIFTDESTIAMESHHEYHSTGGGSLLA